MGPKLREFLSSDFRRTRILHKISTTSNEWLRNHDFFHSWTIEHCSKGGSALAWSLADLMAGLLFAELSRNDLSRMGGKLAQNHPETVGRWMISRRFGISGFRISSSTAPDTSRTISCFITIRRAPSKIRRKITDQRGTTRTILGARA